VDNFRRSSHVHCMSCSSVAFNNVMMKGSCNVHQCVSREARHRALVHSFASPRTADISKSLS
jgi:hypothetical protein